MDKLEKVLERYFGEKAPKLPEKIREIIVMLAPWLTLVGIVITIPVILFALGIGASLTSFALFAGAATAGVQLLWLLFSAATIVLYVLALPGLFKRRISGWRFSYYAVLLGGLESLMRFNLFGLIIGTGIGLYILFQIRSHYH